MRKSLFLMALAISLMVAFAVSIVTVFQDGERGQVAAAVTQPSVDQAEFSIGSKAVDYSPANGPSGSASATSASDSEYQGYRDDGTLEHDGVCPFKGSQL